MLKFWSGTAEKNSGAVSIIVNFIGHKLNQIQTARVQTGLEVPCEALYFFTHNINYFY